MIEYSGIKFYSEENLLVEALTFVLLTCEIDIREKFGLLYYQLQNDYVPWGFSAPIDNDVNNINSVDLFNSLIQVMLRLDVNRKVLQCMHCRTKCSCEVVATYLESEIELFTMQDPPVQVAINHAATLEPEQMTSFDIQNPILLNNQSFIVEVPHCVGTLSSQRQNVMLNDLDTVERSDSSEATLTVRRCNPPFNNYDAWKGHNDDGIPIINFDAMFGHQDKDDLDLQLDCGV